MNKSAVVLLLFFILGTQFMNIAVAQTLTQNNQADAIAKYNYSTTTGDALLANSGVVESKNLGQNKAVLEHKVIKTVLTAYTSVASETDDTPYITASGTYTHEGVAASNFLPIGTKIRIPKLFGGQVFTIEDRMNERYSDRVDIWFASKDKAIIFGLRTANIEIL